MLIDTPAILANKSYYNGDALRLKSALDVSADVSLIGAMLSREMQIFLKLLKDGNYTISAGEIPADDMFMSACQSYLFAGGCSYGYDLILYSAR